MRGSVALEGSQPARKARHNRRIFRVNGKTRGVEDTEHVKHAWAVCFGCSAGAGKVSKTPNTKNNPNGHVFGVRGARRHEKCDSDVAFSVLGWEGRESRQWVASQHLKRKLWVAFQVLRWERGQQTPKTCPHGHVLGVQREGWGGGGIEHEKRVP